MPPKELMDWAVNYGLGVVLAMGIAFAFWRTLMFVLSENSKREERIMRENATREDRLSQILTNHLTQLANAINNMSQILVGSETYFDEIKEANRFQRDEHKEMILILKEIQMIMSNSK